MRVDMGAASYVSIVSTPVPVAVTGAPARLSHSAPARPAGQAPRALEPAATSGQYAAKTAFFRPSALAR